MDGQSACDKCGLKAVRYELERRGIIMRFCDMCYWGALEANESLAGAPDNVKKARVDRPASEGG
jgi:hypothetical protein